MKSERIQDQLEHNPKILLDYGVPLNAIPYKKIWEQIDTNGYSDALTAQATALVEQECKEGRPGAFVIRRIINDQGHDNVEVWGWVS